MRANRKYHQQPKDMRQPDRQMLLGSRGRTESGNRHGATMRRPPRARAPEACVSWNPLDGDALFHGAAGQDVVALRHVTLTQLLSVINVEGQGMSLHLDRDGHLGMLDREGKSIPFSGDITLHGATLRFAAVTRLLLE